MASTVPLYSQKTLHKSFNSPLSSLETIVMLCSVLNLDIYLGLSHNNMIVQPFDAQKSADNTADRR